MKQRKNIRLINYDYSTPGLYFVTVCVKNFKCLLGKVNDQQMVLSEPGKIVREKWLWLRNNFNYIDLDEFVIMPNHIHGILIIKNVGTILGLSPDLNDGTTRELSLRNRRHNLLSKSINAFKTTSSKLIHQSGINFHWQRLFYEHVIDFAEYELENIRDYIQNNPAKWEFDRLNKGIW